MSEEPRCPRCGRVRLDKTRPPCAWCPESWPVAVEVTTEPDRADLDVEFREVLWARVNRVLAEGGDKVDVWWLRSLLQHRDQHDEPGYVCEAHEANKRGRKRPPRPHPHPERTHP